LKLKANTHQSNTFNHNDTSGIIHCHQLVLYRIIQYSL